MRLFDHAVRLLVEAEWVNVVDGVICPTGIAYGAAPESSTSVEINGREADVIHLATVCEGGDRPLRPSIDTGNPIVREAIDRLDDDLVEGDWDYPIVRIPAVRDYMRAVRGTDPAALETATEALREYLAERWRR
jgi:hypothetical protein